METHELKELIGMDKLNYVNLKRVYDYLQDNPGTNTLKVGEALGMGHGVYRYRDLLYAHKLINKNNVCAKQAEKKTRINSYQFPRDVQDGNNSTNNLYVNLAATLAKFDNDDIVPGFDLTKKTILERIAYSFTEVDKNRENFKAMQDSLLGYLALMALVANKLEAFTNMTNIHPVNIEDAKKANLL